jgi:protein-disulfide isomerase
MQSRAAWYNPSQQASIKRMQTSRHSRHNSRFFGGVHLPALVSSALLVAALLAVSPKLCAQLSPVTVKDSSALHPPAGARVAIIEFDDLECPTCAHYNPVLKQAAASYHIPWIRHDFIIPYHNWSRRAAIDARWFDEHSKGLGDEFRDSVFANQENIYNQGVLNQFAQKFAQDHGIALPFATDPQGKLDAEVTADTELGKRMGIDATPTIFVVWDGPHGATYKQITDPDRDLYHVIDDALAATKR